MIMDVQDFAATVRDAHARAMEALGADVHPYSGAAVIDAEAALDAAVDRLVATVRDQEEVILLDAASRAFPDFDFSGCYDADDLRANLQGQANDLRERAETADVREGMLVFLVRFGWLVTVNGERPDASFVRDPGAHDMLLRILQAKDVVAARNALVGLSEQEESPA